MATGYFNNNQEPCIQIQLSNPLGWSQTLECLIDTGFSGFFSVPTITAFPIGLLLTGTMSLTLADGSTAYRLTCLGTATLDNVQRVGVIVIEPSSNQTLLGMDFLRLFSMRLLADPISNSVELIVTTPQAQPPASPPPAGGAA